MPFFDTNYSAVKLDNKIIKSAQMKNKKKSVHTCKGKIGVPLSFSFTVMTGTIHEPGHVSNAITT